MSMEYNLFCSGDLVASKYSLKKCFIYTINKLAQLINLDNKHISSLSPISIYFSILEKQDVLVD